MNNSSRLTNSTKGQSTIKGMAAIALPACLMISIAREMLLARKQNKQTQRKASAWKDKNRRKRVPATKSPQKYDKPIQVKSK